SRPDPCFVEHTLEAIPFSLITVYLTLRPCTSTHFPYTTLFRSLSAWRRADLHRRHHRHRAILWSRRLSPRTQRGIPALPLARLRSEEHTSELQSRENLVCRLLLEKKNFL